MPTVSPYYENLDNFFNDNHCSLKETIEKEIYDIKLIIGYSNVTLMFQHNNGINGLYGPYLTKQGTYIKTSDMFSLYKFLSEYNTFQYSFGHLTGNRVRDMFKCDMNELAAWHFALKSKMPYQHTMLVRLSFKEYKQLQMILKLKYDIILKVTKQYTFWSLFRKETL